MWEASARAWCEVDSLLRLINTQNQQRLWRTRENDSGATHGECRRQLVIACDDGAVPTTTGFVARSFLRSYFTFSRAHRTFFKAQLSIFNYYLTTTTTTTCTKKCFTCISLNLIMVKMSLELLKKYKFITHFYSIVNCPYSLIFHNNRDNNLVFHIIICLLIHSINLNGINLAVV